MLSKNNSVKEIFSKLSGKYAIKRVIANHGYGERVAYFLHSNSNELLYKEELRFNYYNCDNQISAVKEYKYIFENNNITKYFITPENNLFYRLDFIDGGNAVQRIKIREHRRDLQNSLVSDFLKGSVPVIV